MLRLKQALQYKVLIKLFMFSSVLICCIGYGDSILTYKKYVCVPEVVKIPINNYLLHTHTHTHTHI